MTRTITEAETKGWGCPEMGERDFLETAELLWALKLSQISAGGANIGGWTQMSQRVAWAQKSEGCKKAGQWRGWLGDEERMEERVVVGKLERMEENHFTQKYTQNEQRRCSFILWPVSLLQNNHCEVPCLRVYNTRIRKQCVYTFWWLLGVGILAWKSGEPESRLG